MKRLLLVVMMFFVGSIVAAQMKFEQSKGYWQFSEGYYSLKYDERGGRWDLRWTDGKPAITGAVSKAVVAVGGKNLEISSDKLEERTVTNNSCQDGIGACWEVVVTGKGSGGVMFAQVFHFYIQQKFFTVQLRVKPEGEAKVLTMMPVVADASDGGGLFVGETPDKAWTLENGYDYKFDFWVRLVRGTENSISNWDAAVYHPETGRTVVAGFVTNDAAITQVRVSYQEKDSVVDSASGWRGFSKFRGNAKYDFPKKVAAGGEMKSEIFFVGLSDISPHEVLEAFGDAVGRHYGVKIWKDAVPTGWNVWATGYHHDITEENMLENARWAAEHLKPYGQGHFQIDDGWQKAEGDWDANEKFPKGMKWIADQIRSLGLIPGVWLAPFVAGVNSDFAKQHPDWIAPKGPLADLTMPKDWLIIDLSHPEVQKWLDQLFRRVSSEWGYKVIKIDFVYYSLMGKKYYDQNMTPIEVYRKGLEIVKNAVGEDAFLIDVGVPIGTGSGLVDGMRFALDNVPKWADEAGWGVQGLKPMVRNVARRYYINYRVWINHPDMFYLGAPEEEKRWGSRLTYNEARTYATLVAIEGGITKIGDAFVNLNEEQTELLKRLFPVHHGSARPVDLFEMAYPEIWVLDAKIGNEPYKIVTLFNWGLNERWGKQIPEMDRETGTELDKLDMSMDKEYIGYEFWTEQYLGVIKGSIKMNIKARDVRVIALREMTDHPMFLSTNRHVVQGATDIESVEWNESERVIRGMQQVDPNFEYSLKFYVPKGYVFDSAEAGGVKTEGIVDGEILRVKFKFSEGGKKEWIVKFKK
ncbi:MAG: glycoside hydrolase family 36 protein [bacterium]